jgi:hypothetical protein
MKDLKKVAIPKLKALSMEACYEFARVRVDNFDTYFPHFDDEVEEGCKYKPERYYFFNVLNTLDEKVLEELITHNYMVLNMKGPRR